MDLDKALRREKKKKPRKVHGERVDLDRKKKGYKKERQKAEELDTYSLIVAKETDKAQKAFPLL